MDRPAWDAGGRGTEQMEIHLYHHIVNGSAVEAQLSDISAKLGLLVNATRNIMATLDALTAQVAANKTVIDSAVVLINGIAARIAAAGADPVALAALVDNLKASDEALATAVAANTPAA